VNGNRADQGGAASAGRKSVGCTSIPAQRRAVKAIPVDDVGQIARGCKGDNRWNCDALILCEDVAFALRRAPVVALERRVEQAGQKEPGEPGSESAQTYKTKRPTGGAQ